MISYLPIPGGHIKLAERFVDPAFSFAMGMSRWNSCIHSLTVKVEGWNYWYNWVIVLPAELSASAVLINYWDSKSR